MHLEFIYAYWPKLKIQLGVKGKATLYFYRPLPQLSSITNDSTLFLSSCQMLWGKVTSPPVS